MLSSFSHNFHTVSTQQLIIAVLLVIVVLYVYEPAGLCLPNFINNIVAPYLRPLKSALGREHMEDIYTNKVGFGRRGGIEISKFSAPFSNSSLGSRNSSYGNVDKFANFNSFHAQRITEHDEEIKYKNKDYWKKVGNLRFQIQNETNNSKKQQLMEELKKLRRTPLDVSSLNRETNNNSDSHPISYNNNEYITKGHRYSENLAKNEVPAETFRSHRNYAEKLQETYTNSKRLRDAIVSGTTPILDQYEINGVVGNSSLYAGGDAI